MSQSLSLGRHKRFGVLMQLESSKDRGEDSLVMPDLTWVIVAGDDDLLRPKCDGTPLNLSGKRVVICPDLEIVPKTRVLLGEVFNDDYLLAAIAVPPLIGQLVVWSLVGLPNVKRLTGTGRSEMPLVCKLRNRFLVRSFELVEFYRV